MKITVKGSSMIFPAQDIPKELQWISNLDMATTAYIIPFYPVAGRLGCEENGRLEIICNAKGVLYG